MKFIKKSVYAGLLTFVLVAGLTSITMAETQTNSHSGMNMGGNTQTQTQQSDSSHETMAGMPGMENMPGMNNTNSGSTTVEKHESMPGMDPNMPGMEGDGKSSGHGDAEGSAEGVNWLVIGSFLAINALVIIVAGILKPKSIISEI